MLTPSKSKLRLLPGRPSDAEAVVQPLDDAQLLAAVRAGEARAARDLYERCRPVVNRTIRKLLGTGDRDEQDVFQQTMVEIVRSIHRYRGECPLEGWIGSLAAHVVYRNLRHRQVERRVWAQEEPPETAAFDQTGRRAAQRSMIDRVRRHLEAMDPGKAWAFLLHDVHGYDIREIAKIIGVSEAAAQSRLVRGRKEVHERIAADADLADALADGGERGGGSR